MRDFNVTIITESGNQPIAIDPVDIEYIKADMFFTFVHMADGTVYHVAEEDKQFGKRVGYYFKQRGIE